MQIEHNPSCGKPQPLDLALQSTLRQWAYYSHAMLTLSWSGMPNNEGLNALARDLNQARSDHIRILRSKTSGAYNQCLAQQALKFIVPLLRRVRIMADHKAKKFDGRSVTALLQFIAQHLFGAKLSFEKDGVCTIDELPFAQWNQDMASSTREWVNSKPQWFAPIPPQFLQSPRPLKQMTLEARASMFDAQKLRLRQRIEAEMSLDSDELALLARLF